jgi:hypothetical protein
MFSVDFCNISNICQTDVDTDIYYNLSLLTDEIQT